MAMETDKSAQKQTCIRSAPRRKKKKPAAATATSPREEELMMVVARIHAAPNHDR